MVVLTGAALGTFTPADGRAGWGEPASPQGLSYGVNAVGVANGSRHAGRAEVRIGMAAAHATATASTQCRSAAHRRRKRNDTASATTTIKDIFIGFLLSSLDR